MNEILKLVRTAHGITLKELAKNTSKSYQYLSLLEKKQSKPTQSMLEIYSTYFNIPIYIFYMLLDTLKESEDYIDKMYIVVNTIVNYKRSKKE